MRVAFFLWTAAHDRVLTLDNLMFRGRSLENQCCMCCCHGESVDHLLLHRLVTYTLWTFMRQAFGIHWVMPGSVAGLLFCWHQWLGKHSSNIWNLIPGCLMWIVWLEKIIVPLKTLRRRWMSYRFYANVVFLSGLIVGVLMIILLSLSLCFLLY